MLTEVEAAQAVPRSDGFIRRFVEYAGDSTDAPLAYHLGVGLSVLSATAPANLGLWFAGGTLYAPLWCLLIGRSGRDRKSTAIRIGTGILRDASRDLLGDKPASTEGLIESLSVQPTQLIAYSEFGEFLSKTIRGYLNPMKNLYTDLWDNEPQQRRLASRVTRVDTPRLSMVAGVTPAYLDRYSEEPDWTGGFMSRWASLFATRERDIINPPNLEPQRAALVDYLTQLTQVPDAGRCLGFTDKAAVRWVEWFGGLSEQHATVNEIKAGAIARAPIFALKAALLYSFDFGRAGRDPEWRIGMAQLEPAISFAELHLKSVEATAQFLALDKDMRDRNRVLQAITKRWRTKGRILRDAMMLERRADEVLTSLVTEGTIGQRISATGKMMFKRLARISEDEELEQELGSIGSMGQVLPFHSTGEDEGTEEGSGPGSGTSSGADSGGSVNHTS